MVTSRLEFALSFVLALGVGLILYAQDLVGSPLLIAVILSATSLGMPLPPWWMPDSPRRPSANW